MIQDSVGRFSKLLPILFQAQYSTQYVIRLQ